MARPAVEEPRPACGGVTTHCNYLVLHLGDRQRHGFQLADLLQHGTRLLQKAPQLILLRNVRST